ncbi:C6 and C2H2 transcription factor RegA-like protein [Akanthomyces lecanii RCEF 1005]|uniref:pH-response transcription factor pacC/RIM101 n=1 Tax=Akanthomyces lecanii RCEF 1005 TaxID=1081108 RepID=A0A168HPU2_CORDF|nr:C6 and C2H2 transcription factor RegA-like protein [Akanthomyces lecanii RCEF 1005]
MNGSSSLSKILDPPPPLLDQQHAQQPFYNHTPGNTSYSGGAAQYNEPPSGPSTASPAVAASTDSTQPDQSAATTPRKGHVGSNLYACRDCGRSYSRPEHLVRHVQTHTLGRRFICEICQKSFARKDLLRRHVANHANDSPAKRRRKQTSPGPGRVSQACRPCATARVKCEETKPCKRCVSRNLECVSSEIGHGHSKNIAHFPAEAAAQTASTESSEPSPSSHPHQSSIPDTANSVPAAHTNTTPGSQTTQLPHDDGQLPTPESAQEQNNFHNNQMAYGYVHPSTEQMDTSQMLAQPTANMMDPTAMPFFDFLRDVLYDQPFNPSRNADPHGLDVLDFCDNTNLEMTDMDFGLLDNWNLDLMGNMPRSRREGSISRPETAGEVAQMRNALVRGWTESPWRWQPKEHDTGYTELGHMPVSSSQAAKMHLKRGDNKAFRVSEEKLEQSGRDRLLSSVLSTCKTDSSRNQVAASFPTVELMDSMIHIFLAAHACQVSGWIHFPSFKLNEQWPEWIGTAAAAGAVSTPVPTLRKFGFAVQEAIRITIPSRFEANNTAIQNLGLVQSLILWEDIALWSGNRRKMEIAECHLAIPVTMMRYRGKLQRANYPLIEVRASDEGEELEEKWKTWVSREQWKRLAFHCYLREAQVSMTTLTNPCMSYGEMTLPLPESRELWFAPTAAEWKAKYMERHSGQTKRPPSLGDLFYEVHKLPANASRLDLQLSISIYLHGFWSLILEYRQLSAVHRTRSYTSNMNSASSLLLNSRHQELVRELQNFQLVAGDWPDMSVQEQVVLHLLQMNLHVSLDDLQLFSGKEGEDQARRIYPVLQQWAASTAARTAVFGAGQILRCAKMFPRDHLNGFYAVAVHHAALALWTYGVVNKANRQQTMTSQYAYGNVYLDDQDSLSVQRFIGFDQGRPLIRGPLVRGGAKEASLQDTRACMEISQEILRANVSQGKEATPPIVENLCHLIQQLGDAAWAVGLG